MMQRNSTPVRRQHLLALALLAAFGANQDARAQSSVTFGLGVLNGGTADRALFGQYNGLRDRGETPLSLDLEYFRQVDETGATVLFKGSRLFTDTREMGLRWQRQGAWKIGVDLGESLRQEPLTVRSGLLGAGTPSPQVVTLSGGGGSELDLHAHRTALGLSFWRGITPALEFELSLKSEDKEGARLFGVGFTCPTPIAPGCRGATGANVGWAVLMLPEPINANHSQIDARLTYARDRLRLSAGYYASFYRNRFDVLTPSVPGRLINAVGNDLELNSGLQAILNLPVALPPDNQAHQLDVSGLYSLTATTTLNFKLRYAQALQHQDFAASGLSDAPAGVSNLGGRVDTKAVQFGLNARPLPALGLHADLRWEERDDKTPIARYHVEGTSTYTNRHLPNTRTRGKLQANYQFNSAHRGTLTVDAESIDRGVFTASSAVAGISALRQQTDEFGLRAEWRSRWSEEFSGSVGLETSQRDGSNWLRPNSGLGVTEVPDPAVPGSGLDERSIYMPTLADRQRDKLRLRADWQASEDLSLQISAETGKDRYKTPSAQGLRSTRMDQVSVDWNYSLSFRWSLNGQLAWGQQALHQSRHAGYILSFDNRNTNVGFGVAGRPTDQLQLGVGLTHVDDRNRYAQALDATASADSIALLAATGGLPDIVYRQSALKAFSSYDINDKSTVRLDLIHQRTQFNDWSWTYNGVPFVYSDGSTVTMLPKQSVTFLGVSYKYKW